MRIVHIGVILLIGFIFFGCEGKESLGEVPIEKVELFDINNTALIGSLVGKVEIPIEKNNPIKMLTLVGKDSNSFKISKDGEITLNGVFDDLSFLTKKKTLLQTKVFSLKVKIIYELGNIRYINIEITVCRYEKLDENITTLQMDNLNEVNSSESLNQVSENGSTLSADSSFIPIENLPSLPVIDIPEIVKRSDFLVSPEITYPVEPMVRLETITLVLPTTIVPSSVTVPIFSEVVSPEEVLPLITPEVITPELPVEEVVTPASEEMVPVIVPVVLVVVPVVPIAPEVVTPTPVTAPITVPEEEIENKLFIAPLGDNTTGDGTLEHPYANTQAICADNSVTHPDLIIYYRAGIYNNITPEITCSGEENHPVVMKPWEDENVTIKFDSNVGVKLSGNYVKFQNFEVEGIAQKITFKEAISNWWIGSSYLNGRGIVISGHHVEVSNTVVHDVPASGISSENGDFISIRDNVVYNCGWWTSSDSKGIKITNALSLDGSTTEQNIKVENNLIFGVESRVLSRVWSRGKARLTIEEGEGILVESNGSNYAGRYLIKNNFLLFTGRGVVIKNTNKVDFMSNTLYRTGTTITGSDKGLIGENSDELTIENNAISIYRAGSAYGMDENSENVTHLNNCLLGDDTFIIEGLSIVDSIFKDASNLDFSIKNSACFGAGASMEVWAKLKAKVANKEIEIKPTNWTHDYSDMTREIIAHIPKEATADFSDWNNTQEFTINVSNVADEAKGRGSEFVLEVVHPYRRDTSSLASVFSDFNVGFGGAPSFPFLSEDNQKIWLSMKSLLLDSHLENNGYYKKIKDFNATSIVKLQENLQHSKFLVFWFVDGWKESWYNKDDIQKLMNAGYIPVFSYWYFGDRLLEGLPSEAKKEEYREDNRRVAKFLSMLHGKKMILMEPEFNKLPVIESEATQHEFASIISEGIDILKEKNPDLIVSLSMMDTGNRGIYEEHESCGYDNCSLGDQRAWVEPEIVYTDLLDKLDFISFHQMMAQFSRDYDNPGGWDTPNLRKYNEEELGIEFLGERIANFSKFLHEKYNKPIFMPYITFATGTWDDQNSNNEIEDNELNYYGWVNQAEHVYKRLAELRPTLQENGLFGYATMSLFDHPRHDYEEYQYFMKNEYHLGIVGSSAIDELDSATRGDLYFKGKILEYIFTPESVLDSDNDGIPDKWELDNGLDSLNGSNAVTDSDGDGYSDLYEYQHNTDPNDIDSAPTGEITLLSSNESYPLLDAQQQNSLNSFITLQETGEIRLHAVSKNWLRLTLIPKRDDNGTAFERQPLEVSNAENIALFSLKDENNNTLSILKTGLKRRTIYAPIQENDLRLEENIFIQIGEELEDKKRYHLSLNSVLTGTAIEIDMLFDPQNQLSDLIHVNPYGFRPEDSKKAYLGLMMGSAGEFETTDLLFEVIKSSDKSVVYQGTATIETSEGWRESFANEPYSKVYRLDFSSLKEADEYYIRHSSGISQPFTIHSDAYRNAMNTLALGMYHQRRGESLTLPFTRFEHNATIEDETYIYDSDNLDAWLTSQAGWGDGIKYPTTLEREKVEISGGHMDAGDYSPYTYNSAMTAWTMITTLDLFGRRVEHDNLGLPESGDNVSDLLQEFLIEINWLKDMQDPVDGGVFGMSKPKGMSYQSTMPGADASLERYLAPKDTTVTAGYAASLARAARSRVLQKHNNALATVLKERAIKAWEWLALNEGMHGYHHYGQSHKDGTDEGHEHARAWAAIELYALTGEQKYHDAFVLYHKPLQRDNGVYWMNEGYGYTIRTLALWERDKIPYLVDETLKNSSIERFKGAMDNYVIQASKTPYNLIVDDVIKRWNVVGWYFPISSFSWDLLVAHEIYQNPDYLEVAEDQIHFTLGANPSNMTYITGMGYKQLKSTVDQESRFDGIKAPVVGLPVSPMVTGYSWNNSYKTDINSYTYPKDNPDDNESVYGILESAYDGWNINAEFTIEKMAGMLSCLAILTPRSDEMYSYPKFTLLVTSLSNGEFKPLIEFENGTPEHYTVLWYENDKAVSSDSNYTLKQDFTKPIWKLSAEVVTLEGRRWYSEVTINTRDYNNSNIPLEPFNEENLSAIFHFDNTLNDEKNTTIILTLEGEAHFDDSNLNWMQNQAGQALRFDGIDDKVTTIFKIADYLLEGNTTENIKEVSISGLFYMDALDDDSHLLNLFYFRQGWEHGFQLTRYTWSKDIRADLGKTENANEQINQALTLHSWHYIELMRTVTHDILKVDGKEIVKVEHEVDILFDERDIMFELGNFYGWVDELKIDVKVDN